MPAWAAGPREGAVGDVEVEVLADLEAALDPRRLLGDFGGGERLAGAPRHFPGDALEAGFGGREQFLALAPPALGEQRVAAHHQALAGVGVGGDLRQAALVEQRRLEGPALGQLADRAVAQRRYPAEAGAPAQIRDAGVGEHAAVAHQHHPLQPEGAAQPLDLARQRARIGRVAGVRPHRHRAAFGIRQKAVHDHRATALAVAAVAEARQRTGAALVVAAADIVERLPALGQVPPRQPALNALLALAQPVHRLVQGVLVHGAEAQLPGQRAVAQQPRRRQLGRRAQHPLGDQRQRPVAPRRAAAVEQRRHAEAAHGLQHDLDMAVGEGALDGEGFARGGEGFVAEHAAQQFDLGGGPGREVGDGALADAAAFAPALAEEDGGLGVPVRDGFDVHGNIISGVFRIFQKNNREKLPESAALIHGNNMQA